MAKSLKTHSGPQVRDIADSSLLVVIVTEAASRQGSKHYFSPKINSAL